MDRHKCAVSGCTQADKATARQVAAAMGLDKYRVVNGTSYPVDTDPTLVFILEGLRSTQNRVIINYGGYAGAGYISRTSGPRKSPLLVYNRRSVGGDLLSLDSIESIRHANKKNGTHTLYQRP